MPGMCSRCPRRDTALLLRELGQIKQADQIEREGCPWFWAIQETNGSGAVRITEKCGAEVLPEFLTDFGAKIIEALQTAQSSRNEVAKGFERLASAVETSPLLVTSLFDLRDPLLVNPEK